MRLHRAAVAVAAVTSLGLLAPMAPASAATVKSPNLIKDSGGESAKQADKGGTTIVKVPFWTPVAGTGFTVVTYGSPDFIQKTDPGPKVRGHNFFSGGELGPSPAGATQVVALKPYLSWIKTGKAPFTLAGYFGGWASQRDYATLTVTWENAAGTKVGKATAIGDVTPGQRKNMTELLARSKAGLVPATATQALLKLKLVRLDGGYDDGYADNLSLILSKS